MRHWLELALAIGLVALGAPLEPLGRLSHPAIQEASGIVKSRRHPQVFWVHNDSGNPPALFAVRRDGSLIREFAVQIPNIDWEDIATDHAGHLYLGEIGNNDGRLPIRAIYRLDEPDPSRPADRPLPITAASFYRFPAGKRFDAESLVIDGRRAIVVAKTSDNADARLYAIPLDPPAPLLRPSLPEPIGSLPGFTEPATGADLSADGRLLAVCSYRVARVYQKTRAGAWKRLGTVRFQASGIEAICWDGRDLILVGEGRDVFRIAEATWRAGVDRRQTGR
jgi:hypothetical protein